MAKWVMINAGWYKTDRQRLNTNQPDSPTHKTGK
jgi:hypothetical protein